jgi:ATP-dependent helicase HrpB
MGELKRYLGRNREVFFSSFPSVKRLLLRISVYHRLSDALPEQDRIDLPWDMILEGLLSGKTRLSGIEENAVLEMIEGFLDRESKRKLDQDVPDRIEVPSGNLIPVDYENDPPRLSVRLQEVFGWVETPRIGRGRIPLLMELLSPGFKPMQVTRDLGSFWASAYFEVRKELKARYPKHSWPEDPIHAEAVSYRRKLPPKNGNG